MIELLRDRRSIRVYKDEIVDRSDIKILEEALQRSPTSRNIRPWKFWFVEDRSLLKKLSNAKESGSKLIEKAPLAVVIGADTTMSDVWIEDCSIASILLQLTAQSLNLGSCWVQIRNRKDKEGRSSEDVVRETLAIPNHIAIESIIAIGHPAEERLPLNFDELPEGVISHL